MTVNKFELYKDGKLVGYEKIYRWKDGSYRIHHADPERKNSGLWAYRPVFMRYRNGDCASRPENFIPHDRAMLIEDGKLEPERN